MRDLTRLGFRNLLRNRVRTAITLAVVTFGVCGLILSGGFIRDIFVQLGEALIHSQSGHAQIGREALFSFGSRSPERYLLEKPEALRSYLAEQPEVKNVMARITFSGLLNNGKTDYPVIVDGIEADRENELGTFLHLVSGRMLTDKDQYGAVIGEGVANALRLKAGDQATLLVNTIDGAMNTLDVEIVGVFQSFSKDFDARAMRIALPDAQSLLATDGIGKYVLELHRTDQTAALVQRVRANLPAGDVVVRDWEELNDFYGKAVELYQQQFGFLKATILLMVCLSVINTVNMSLAERSWEFGTMRALGNRNRTVIGLILTESLVLGLAGALIGTLFGLLLAAVISGIGIPMPPPPNANLGYDAYIRIETSDVLESALIGTCATLIAAIYPAWRTTRLSIIDALRARE
ncbi:ABC transporter permease [Azoarcus indigens]|uniref:Putative ABC transport system permease protein n=1 Tax=Azoarcus indigens TaxID=29545 RepID=A0A4R6DIN5_9RHOO|nr:FtsX-like permease family protein [Azoarcus indigens]TDN44503.1 putative ABC transport system permease protein [Azoarcus indigens]